MVFGHIESHVQQNDQTLLSNHTVQAITANMVQDWIKRGPLKF